MNHSSKIKNLMCLILVLFCFIPSGCSADKSKSEPNSNNSSSVSESRRPSEILKYDDDFTLLIYMCGSSLESKNGSASDDISELLSADIPKNVNVVLETGGTQRWKKHGISADKLQRYMVADNKLELLEEEKLSCMGDSSTLREFIDWGTQKFPAKRTALILWDHGGGFLKGICRDELYKNDWLTVQEFDEALYSSSFQYSFDFIGFDCCLMSNYETALVVSEYSDYMIASEDLEPTGGWDYKSIANSLGNGNEIMTILNSFTKAHSSKADYTLSAIDLTQLEKIKSAFQNCIDRGKTDFEKAINSTDSIRIFSSCVYDMGSFGDSLNIDFDFSDCITVVSSGDMSNLSGISFCFPVDDRETMEEYIQNCRDDNYTEFIKNNFNLS